jgi:hypothetical protein
VGLIETVYLFSLVTVGKMGQMEYERVVVRIVEVGRENGQVSLKVGIEVALMG